VGRLAVPLGIVVGLTNWLCISFGKKNRRYFSLLKKHLTIVLMVLAIFCLQFLFLLAWPELIGQNNGLLILSIIFGLIFLHVPFIYLAFGTCKKHLIAKNVRCLRYC